MTAKRLRVMYDVFRFGVACDFKDRSNDEFGQIAKCLLHDSYNSQILFDISRPIPIATIAHEMVHCLRWELGKRGFISIEDGLDETLAYCVGYGVGEVIAFCRKHNFKLKDKEENIYK